VFENLIICISTSIYIWTSWTWTAHNCHV